MRELEEYRMGLIRKVQYLDLNQTGRMVIMKLSQSVKPISYFKAHAAEIIKNLSENAGTMVITQNGQAKAVVQDIHTYEQIQESLALLKILAQGRKEIEQGEIYPAEKVLGELEARIEKDFKA